MSKTLAQIHKEAAEIISKVTPMQVWQRHVVLLQDDEPSPFSMFTGIIEVEFRVVRMVKDGLPVMVWEQYAIYMQKPI